MFKAPQIFLPPLTPLPEPGEKSADYTARLTSHRLTVDRLLKQHHDKEQRHRHENFIVAAIFVVIATITACVAIVGVISIGLSFVQ